MGKHYVPRFYLEGFTKKNEPSFIWVYEKFKSKPFRTNIINVAQENKIYSDETEDFLTIVIENPANQIITKIRNRHNITQSDKVLLADYMSILMKRVPKSRNLSKKWFDENKEDYFQSVDIYLEKKLVDNPAKQEVYKRYREELKIIRKNGTIKPEVIWQKGLLSDQNTQLSRVFCDMTWQFLVFDKWPAFLTSDNPVFFFEGIGLNKEQSEVSFPISKNIVLWATWRSDLKEGYIKTTDNIVKEINRRTISFATKYIFFSSLEKWIVKLTNQDNIEINRIL